MKLLRIEAVNLNSFYGAHVLDLEETVGGASIFLIFGPTGSGKSTLMDAVSLALFGRTPRLNEVRGNEATDPAAIMSRGTGECSATVVFSKLEEGGRRTYRAQWTCRRARKKPDGNLQTPVRSIERLEPDGEWRLLVSSTKKKDYGPVLEEVLDGFDVQDFNRSMLLAQGQFDAFLGAPSSERAEILERLTDTSIYQEIGDRAAQIHRAHADHIRRLRQRAEAGGGLEAAELATLVNAHEEHEAELKNQDRALTDAKGRLSWFDGDVEYRKKLEETIDHLARFEVESREAAEGMKRLAEHDRCVEAEAFALLDSDTSARASLAKVDLALESATKSAPALEVTASAAKKSATDTVAKRVQADKELEALRPLVTKATQAASAEVEATKLVAAGAEGKKEADGRFEEATEALTLAITDLEKAKRGVESVNAELTAHRGDAGFVEEWGSLRTRLDQLISNGEGVAAKQKELEERGQSLGDEKGRISVARDAHGATFEGKSKPIRGALDLATAALGTLLTQPDFEASRDAADAVVESEKDRERQARDAVAPVTEARRSAAVLARSREELRGQSSKLSEAQGAHAATAREAERLGAAATQAREEWERISRMAELVAHRAKLVDGDPCALCGSEAHPWAHDSERRAADAVIDGTVLTAKGKRDEAQKALDEARRALTKADHASRDLSAKIDVLREKKGEAAERQVELDRAAAAALEKVALSSDSSVADVEESLEKAVGRVREAEKALSGLTTAQREVAKLESQLRKLTDDEKAADLKLREDEAKAKERGRQLAADQAKHETGTATLAKERGDCRALYGKNGGTVEGDDPAAWRDAGDQRRRDHEARTKAVTDQKALAESATTARKGKRELVEARKAERDTRTRALHALETDREAKARLVGDARTALAEVWTRMVRTDDARPSELRPTDGMSPSEQLELQKGWVNRTTESEKRARETETTARTALARVRTELQMLTKQQSEQRGGCADTRADLETVIAALSLSGRDALAELRLGADVLAEERAKRTKLVTRKAELTALEKERREKVDAHALVRPEGLREEPSREALTEEVVATKALHEGAAKDHQETGDRLRDHHRAAKEHEENQKKLRDAEETARVWQTLHDMIGVNDGQRFKEFAQALNLDHLLSKANVHLSRLLKRYRLVSPREEGLPTLEFVLEDLWQGNEHVAPRSLSGGERFLVALALALGLSDFRAVKMPIETLLLDEGFGTLDPDALNVALGALCQLQADGRQVGIISHVVGLQEGIEARIEVRQLGGGRSKVVTAGG